MGTDYSYLKKHHLTEAYKRFQAINEYIVAVQHPNEADDRNQQPPAPGPDMGQGNNPAQGAGMPPQGPAQPGPGMPPQGPDQPGMGAPAQDGMGNPAQDPMGNPAPDNMGAPAQDPMGTPGPDNMEAPEGDMPPVGTDATPEPEDDKGDDADATTEGEGDEVVDVDDLTQSQEASEYKLDGVDQKLTTLLSVVGKLTKAIENNDEKVEDLKKEIALRNPSHQEHLNIRSQSGKPFNVNPTEYWDQTSRNNPNYNVITDNDVSPSDEEKLYTITLDDLKGANNNSELDKSFDDIPKNLKDYFA